MLTPILCLMLSQNFGMKFSNQVRKTTTALLSVDTYWAANGFAWHKHYDTNARHAKEAAKPLQFPYFICEIAVPLEINDAARFICCKTVDLATEIYSYLWE